jgi:hypothetical protein
VEGSCEHGNEPSGSINAGKFMSSCTTGSFSRRAQLPSNLSGLLFFVRFHTVTPVGVL